MTEPIELIVQVAQPVIILMVGGLCLWFKRRLKLSDEQGDLLLDVARAGSKALNGLVKEDAKAKEYARAFEAGVDTAGKVWNDAKAPTDEMMAAADLVDSAVSKIVR